MALSIPSKKKQIFIGQCLQVRLSEVHLHMVPDSRLSRTEGSVAEVGPSKNTFLSVSCMSISQAQSSWVGVSDEAAGSMPRQYL